MAMTRGFLAFASAVVLLAACDDVSTNYYDYLKESFIDTVLVGDSVRNNEPARIVHVRPEGCNHFERFESKPLSNGLSLAVLYHWYFEGQPCAHGPGLDTTSYVLSFPDTGVNVLRHRVNESWTVLRFVHVVE